MRNNIITFSGWIGAYGLFMIDRYYDAIENSFPCVSIIVVHEGNWTKPLNNRFAWPECEYYEQAQNVFGYGLDFIEKTTFLRLTEKSYVKLGIDDTGSTYYINISASDDEGASNLKTSGKYYYIACADILKILGLYGSNPSIYELIKEKGPDSESVFKLVNIINIKDPRIGWAFKNKDELRSIIAMLHAKI